MNSQPNREVALFSAALELPASQRAAYLAEACADDPALRQRLEALLGVHEKAITFLENPPPGAQESPAEAELPTATLRLTSVPSEKPGDRIGRYKLLQQIGEGGCGIVYMAEQEEPVRRRVALKVIKLGMDTKQVIARFEAERQAVALMDHPNIAKVLEAGATDAGRPYFVMELVRGVKITEYCDQNNLSTCERLKLFIQVCHAVQHAHQKGIIHRDIKPSNILVASNDGMPVPKVIDFGIAKATQGRLTDQTLFTALEQFIGTPAYMSPEQAELTMFDVDTRTDIYSLGVLLYELLVGRTPFDANDLLAAGLDAMRRTIREQEPERPSTRLSTMAVDALTMTAQHRHTEAPRLLHLIRGDLDWIVMKALEKDRARRYETANGLAVDIERHLNNEPVVARPPSRLYRFQKSVLRNKLAFAAVGAVTLSLSLGLGLSTWLFLKERQAHQRAVAAEKTQIRLRQEADSARLQAEADKQKAATETAKNAAVALTRMANSLRKWEANLPEVEKMLREALALQTQLLGDEDPLVADALNNLATALERQGKLEEAESMLRDSLAKERRLLGDDHKAVLWRLGFLVDFVRRHGRYEDAQRLMTEILTPVIVNQPQNYELLRWRGTFFAEGGRWNEAIADFTKAVELQPTNHFLYHWLTPLLAASGDTQGYHRLCQQMIRTFKGTRNPVIGDVVAKDCLILPASEAELRDIAPFADTAVTAGENHFALPWFQACKALVEYRQGRPANAASWARKALIQAGPIPERDTLAYTILAMAEHKSGRPDEARANLAKGLEIANIKFPKPGNGSRGNSWVDYVIAKTLLVEAQALVKGKME